MESFYNICMQKEARVRLEPEEIRRIKETALEVFGEGIDIIHIRKQV